jgi:hypothetical protein
MEVGRKILQSRDDGRVVEAQTGQIRGQARPRCVQGAQTGLMSPVCRG